MSRDRVRRDRRNWKGRLKGRALGAFQLETWHEQCRKLTDRKKRGVIVGEGNNI